MSSWTRCLLIILTILSVCSARPAVFPFKPADTPSPANSPNPTPASEAPLATSSTPVTSTSSAAQPIGPAPSPEKSTPSSETTPTNPPSVPTVIAPINNTEAVKPRISEKLGEPTNAAQINTHIGTNPSATPFTTIQTVSQGNSVITKVITYTPSSNTSGHSTPAADDSRPAQRQNSSEGGSNRSLVAAGVSVGVVVVLASVGIFIFRKWKLSPSRHFRSKLEEGESYHQLPSRTGSRRDLTAHTQDTVFLKELHS